LVTSPCDEQTSEESTAVNDEQHIYQLTWRHPFWGYTEEGILEAPDLDTAIALAPPESARGLPISEIAGPEGVAVATITEPPDYEACFLIEHDGRFAEEVVHAPTVSSAWELVAMVIAPEARVVAFSVDGFTMRPDEVEDGFWERPGIPAGWAPTD
jgi:hypothetical protein